jgi:hypothetical protein
MKSDKQTDSSGLSGLSIVAVATPPLSITSANGLPERETAQLFFPLAANVTITESP